MEIGIYTFVDRTPDSQTGQTISAAQRLADLLEEVELADQVGLDVFAVGEHHRPEYVASAPAVILGAAAARTKNIRLSSAVTVLSSDDPVRVFQQFSTVDLLSGGRAEIMAGRGSFIESFPLFGYSLDDYDSLFSEKLEMLLEIRSNEKLNWSGKHRAPVKGLGVYPRPLQDPLPVWIAVGGTPGSVIRAGKLGLPIAFAIIGGDPRQFAPLVQLYLDTGEAAGFTRDQLKVSINSHAFVADTSKAAADTYYGPYAYVMSKIGQERGWPPMNRAQFERMRAPGGSLLVGDPQEVIDKILYEHELFGHDRFLAQMEVGTMPHKELMRAIELLGTKVAPAIHKALGK
jgi:probable LLM family oxidoreductase